MGLALAKRAVIHMQYGRGRHSRRHGSACDVSAPLVHHTLHDFTERYETWGGTFVCMGEGRLDQAEGPMHTHSKLAIHVRQHARESALRIGLCHEAGEHGGMEGRFCLAGR